MTKPPEEDAIAASSAREQDVRASAFFVGDWTKPYRPGLLNRMQLVKEYGANYLAAPCVAHRDVLQDHVHKLAGIAGGLGCREISIAAQGVDRALDGDPAGVVGPLADLVELVDAELTQDD